MDCPKCGNENRDDADFCSLCLAELPAAGRAIPHPVRQVSPPAINADAPVNGYVSPGEWRGRSLQVPVVPGNQVQRNVRRARLKNITFASVVLAVVVALVLMMTVWGNKTPEKVASEFLAAASSANTESAAGLVVPGNDILNRAFVSAVLAELAGAKFESPKLKVVRTDQDAARAELVGGVISGLGGSGGSREITASDGLYVGLLMKEGRWYIDPYGSNLLP